MGAECHGGNKSRKRLGGGEEAGGDNSHTERTAPIIDSKHCRLASMNIKIQGEGRS